MPTDSSSTIAAIGHSINETLETFTREEAARRETEFDNQKTWAGQDRETEKPPLAATGSEG